MNNTNIFGTLYQLKESVDSISVSRQKLELSVREQMVWDFEEDYEPGKVRESETNLLLYLLPFNEDEDRIEEESFEASSDKITENIYKSIKDCFEKLLQNYPELKDRLPNDEECSIPDLYRVFDNTHIVWEPIDEVPTRCEVQFVAEYEVSDEKGKLTTILVKGEKIKGEWYIYLEVKPNFNTGMPKPNISPRGCNWEFPDIMHPTHRVKFNDIVFNV